MSQVLGAARCPACTRVAVVLPGQGQGTGGAAEIAAALSPRFAKQASAGLGRDRRWPRAVYSPYGVAGCLKISKAVPKLGERRWRGPSAVPTAGAGLSLLHLCSAGSLQPSEDWVRTDHRLFLSVGGLQGILFYRMSFLLPVVQSHPCARCLSLWL